MILDSEIVSMKTVECRVLNSKTEAMRNFYSKKQRLRLS